MYVVIWMMLNDGNTYSIYTSGLQMQQPNKRNVSF